MAIVKGYTGQYNDPLSGLDYYVARYYDPVVGLFLSADTVQSNLLGFNPYAYVGENPETLTEPTGKFFSCGLYCGAVLRRDHYHLHLAHRGIRRRIILSLDVDFPVQVDLVEVELREYLPAAGLL